ncbi:MAG: transcriptional repressor [Opitutae bacterium]|jgi:Fur family peroxide stress response transcriptional regulator|nr:transcriptional repressor [Opitutae bacterium]MBT4223344.1 transcriptional repressor [Opitutae bacterium]MBT6463930.1 transcriptional repressor [Opitutae bacterium]MBT6958153.1 transcriptional repressor [Opitutae bacterium]MBT7851780.1 transcriptional repressor [Opitutae bacterium]
MIATDDRRECLQDAITRKGMRYTKQREHIFNILMDNRDHPTADEVFLRARLEMPSMSLATVYNSLDTLVECGLVRQVHIERESTRYCPNLSDHAHFHCEETGQIYDVDLPNGFFDSVRNHLPEGFKMGNVEILIRGNSH